MLPEQQTADCVRESSASADATDDRIVGNLVKAVDQLDEDLDRAQLWTAALSCLLQPVPDYQPSQDYVLPAAPRP